MIESYMKRDMDLIREILRAVEKETHGHASPEIEIQGHTQEEIKYHVFLLGEAGLARVVVLSGHDNPSPAARMLYLTWQGHEFLDVASKKDTWNQAKDKIAKVGGASIAIWKDVLTDLIKKQLGI